MVSGRSKLSSPARTGKPKSPAAGSASPAPLTLFGKSGRFLESSPWAIPTILFLLSFGFRLHFMNEGLFHHDEVLLARAVETTVEKAHLTGAFNGRYGAVVLNLLLYLPWNALSGQSAEKIVPLAGVLTGALLVSTLYLLVLDLTGKKLPAVLSSLFLNFNFLFLTTSTTGKENTAQLFFTVLGLYLLLAGAARGSWPRKAAGAAAFAYSLSIHEAGIPLIPLVVLFLVFLNLDRSRGWRPVVGDNAVLLLFSAIPFTLYLGDVTLAQLTVKSTHTVGFAGLFSPILGISLRDLYTITRLPLLVLAGVGILVLFRRPLLLIPLLLWVLLILYYGNVTSYAPRYLVYIVIPLAVLAGIGGSHLTGYLRSSLPRAAAAGALLALVCGFGIADAYPLIHFRSEYSGPKRMAEYVRRATEPDAVIITMDESVFVEYYAHRKVLTHPVVELEPNRRFVEEVLAIAKSGKKVYVNSTAFSYDYQQHFQRLILENFKIIPAGEVQDEDYHRPELSFSTFSNRLFRIVPK